MPVIKVKGDSLQEILQEPEVAEAVKNHKVTRYSDAYYSMILARRDYEKKNYGDCIGRLQYAIEVLSEPDGPMIEGDNDVQHYTNREGS